MKCITSLGLVVVLIGWMDPSKANASDWTDVSRGFEVKEGERLEVVGDGECSLVYRGLQTKLPTPASILSLACKDSPWLRIDSESVQDGEGDGDDEAWEPYKATESKVLMPGRWRVARGLTVCRNDGTLVIGIGVACLGKAPVILDMDNVSVEDSKGDSKLVQVYPKVRGVSVADEGVFKPTAEGHELRQVRPGVFRVTPRDSLNYKAGVAVVTLPEPPPSTVHCKLARHDGLNVPITWLANGIDGLAKRALLPCDGSCDWRIACSAEARWEELGPEDKRERVNLGWSFRDARLTDDGKQADGTWLYSLSVSTPHMDGRVPKATPEEGRTNDKVQQLEKGRLLITLGPLPDMLEVARGLSTAQGGSSGARSLSGGLTLGIGDALRALGELALERAQAGAFELAQEKLVTLVCTELVATGKLAGQLGSVEAASRHGSKKLLLPRTCSAIEAARLQDLAAHAQGIVRAVAEDALALGRAALELASDDASQRPPALEHTTERLQALLSALLMGKDLAPIQEAQLLLTAMAEDVVAEAERSPDMTSCSVALAMATLAHCHAESSCDARFVVDVLSNPAGYFGSSRCISLLETRSAQLRELGPFVVRGLEILRVAPHTKPREVAKGAIDLVLDLAEWHIRTRAVELSATELSEAHLKASDYHVKAGGDEEKARDKTKDFLAAQVEIYSLEQFCLEDGALLSTKGRTFDICKRQLEASKKKLTLQCIEKFVALAALPKSFGASSSLADFRADGERCKDGALVALEDARSARLKDLRGACAPAAKYDIPETGKAMLAAIDEAAQQARTASQWARTACDLAAEYKRQSGADGTYTDAAIIKKAAAKLAVDQGLAPAKLLAVLRAWQRLTGAIIDRDSAAALEATGEFLRLAGESTSSGPRSKAFRVLSAISSYSRSYLDSEAASNPEKAREIRKEALGSLMDSVTDRRNRSGDWVVSLGASVGLGYGGRFMSGEGDTKGLLQPLRMPMGLAFQWLPDPVGGLHFQLYAVDLGQFLTWGPDQDVSNAEWHTFLTPGLQIGALLGDSKNAFVLGLDVHYASPRSGLDAYTQFGVFFGYYVPFFDFN